MSIYQARQEKVREAIEALSQGAREFLHTLLVQGSMERERLTRCPEPWGEELLGEFENTFLEVCYPRGESGPPYVKVKEVFQEHLGDLLTA